MVFKVVIVGAGIAGLAVAHALERAKKEDKVKDLQVIVYERRQEESSFQKYPIHIAPDGREALSSLLSDSSMDKLLTLTSHGIDQGGIIMFNPQRKRLFGVNRYVGEQPQFAHRWVLKEVLEEGVDVRRGKTVVRVKSTGNKEEVVFEDGASEIADLVIGADGLGSIIRAQLHPAASRFPLLPNIVVQFKLATTGHALRLPGEHMINMMHGTKGYSLLLVPFQGSPLPPFPSFSQRINTANPFMDDPHGASRTAWSPLLKALDEPNPEYVFGNITMSAFPQWEDMTQEAWIARISEILKTDNTDKSLECLVTHAIIPETVGAWQIVSWDETRPVPYSGRRIVLIGDAMHAMPPQGGVGGSTAFFDADQVTKALLASKELGGSGGDLTSQLMTFHKEMVVRARGYTQDAKRRLRLVSATGVLNGGREAARRKKALAAKKNT